MTTLGAVLSERMRPLLTVALVAATAACGPDREPEAEAVRETVARASDRAADAWITMKIQSQLFADDDVRPQTIDVDTVDGRVTLTGVLDTEEAKAQALAIARTTDGVTSVDDRLFLATESRDAPATTEENADEAITTRVRAAFFTDPRIKPWNVDVQTSDGTVLLSGVVDDEAARQRAVEVASRVEGVIEVVDRLSTSSGATASGTMPPVTSEPGTTPPGERDGSEGALATIDDFVTDAGITMRLQAKYFTDGDLDGSDIDVTTENGVVTLSGRVTSEGQRQEAVSMAQNTSGVRDVRDNLAVGADTGPDTVDRLESGAAEVGSRIADSWITTRITARFFLDDDLRSADVSVETSEGTVTLSGRVADSSLEERMLRIAGDVEGVVNVVDQIEVEPSS